MRIRVAGLTLVVILLMNFTVILAKAAPSQPHNADAMWVEPAPLSFNTNTTSVGFKFNVTVAMNFTEDVFAWEAVLYYNATQLTCIRVGGTNGSRSEFMTGHSTFFGTAFNSGAYPPINGSLQSVVVWETCSEPDFISGPRSGTLFWAEFQIMLAPSAGQTLSSMFDISTEYALTNTYVWDSNADPYTFTPYDGTYQYIIGHSGELVPLPDTFVTVMEPSTLGWDTGIGSPFVIYDAGLYKMWYWAFDQPGGLGRRAIAYAESNDGITWFNNQVVHDAARADYSTDSPWVMKEGGTYRMWHADYWEWIDGDWSAYIAHMTSTDGISWPAFMSADDQKVLSAQGQTNPQGDGYDIWDACVIHESSGYVMWYTVNDHPQPGVSGPSKIWRATSTDGITWSNRQLSLPYIPDTWEGSLGHASVVKEDDGTYTMFYGAGYSAGAPNVSYPSIGIAQSSDGISWVNRTQLLKPSDLGANITSIGDPFHFTDVNGKRYLYFTYNDGEYKLGRIQLSALPHDVAITNITPSKTVVGQGYSMNITATATNQGAYTETFNVTAYANATIIGSENVTLPAGNSMTLTFTWNTSGFAYGNYTLSAYAWPVPGETDMADNNFTGGWVIVSIPGDLTGGTPNPWDFVPDGKCDGKDITIVALCYGSAPGCPPPYRWNANCDVNNDGKIDGKDIALVALHYGQAGP